MFAIERFSTQPFEIAIVLVVGGVANAIVQGGLIGRLVPRFGEKRLAIIGLTLQVLGFIATIFAPELQLFDADCGAGARRTRWGRCCRLFALIAGEQKSAPISFERGAWLHPCSMPV